MNHKNRTFWVIMMVSVCLQAWSQTSVYQALVVWSPTHYADYKCTNPKSNHLKWELIAPELNVWLVKSSLPLEVSELYKIRGVQLVSIDMAQPIRPRSVPNDPQISNQEYLGYRQLSNGTYFGTNIYGAWYQRLAPTTLLGDTIAIAFIDQTFRNDLEDIDYHINRGEIPQDSIDNDGNGAIDDYIGYNADYNMGLSNYAGDAHGIRVLGRAAAIANNNLGMAGAAHHVKAIPIEGFRDVISIIRAHNYVLKLKKDYIQSKGQKGAYVVVVNVSGGVYGFESDQPIWCSIYDSLGAYGILSVSAVDNAMTNVEVGLGDIPTNCSSEYLITTTQASPSNVIASGYGPNHVDIATYGDPFGPSSASTYDMLSSAGSSYAAPLVAGTIALMYQQICTKALDSLHANPKSILPILKRKLLGSTDPIASMRNLTVSGGILNAAKAVQSLVNCDSLVPRSSIDISNNERSPIVYLHQRTLYITQLNEPMPIAVEIYDMLGQLVQKSFIGRFDKNTLDLHHLLRGVYILEIKRDQQTIERKKINIY